MKVLVMMFFCLSSHFLLAQPSNKIINDLIENAKEEVKGNISFQKSTQSLAYYDAALSLSPDNIWALVGAREVCRKTVKLFSASTDVEELLFFHVKHFYYSDRLLKAFPNIKNPKKELNKETRIILGIEKKTKIDEIIEQLKNYQNKRDDILGDFLENKSSKGDGVEFAFFNCQNAKCYQQIKDAYVQSAYNALMNDSLVSVDMYDKFLIQNPDYKNNTNVVRKRDSLAWVQLFIEEELTTSLVEEFIVNHPGIKNQEYNSVRFITLQDSLISKRNNLAYQALNIKNYDDCVRFLSNYPESEHEESVIHFSTVNFFQLAHDSRKSASYQRYLNKYPKGKSSDYARSERDKALFKEIKRMGLEVQVKELNKLISSIYTDDQSEVLYQRAMNYRDSIEFYNLLGAGAQFRDYNVFISSHPSSIYIDSALHERNSTSLDAAKSEYGRNIIVFNEFLLQQSGWPIYLNEEKKNQDYVNLENFRLQLLFDKCKEGTEEEQIKKYRIFIYLFNEIADKKLIEDARKFILDKGKNPNSCD